MSEDQDWRDHFIGELQKLEQNEDRGTLAKLRRGLGKEVSTVLISTGWLFNRTPDWALKTASLTATLFAFHSAPGGRGNLGHAFSDACRDKSDEQKRSTEKRLVWLMDCDRADLDGHLRQAISFLKAQKIPVPIDWRKLLDDVLAWDSETRHVQQRWAREFWTNAPREESANADEPTITETVG